MKIIFDFDCGYPDKQNRHNLTEMCIRLTKIFIKLFLIIENYCNFFKYHI